MYQQVPNTCVFATVYHDGQDAGRRSGEEKGNIDAFHESMEGEGWERFIPVDQIAPSGCEW